VSQRHSQTIVGSGGCGKEDLLASLGFMARGRGSRSCPRYAAPDRKLSDERAGESFGFRAVIPAMRATPLRSSLAPAY
jgi:hypothetical protein